MRNLIAQGLVKAGEGVEMYASVYADFVAGEEQATKYVVMSYKKLGVAASEMPKDALTFATMTAGAAPVVLAAEGEGKTKAAPKAAALGDGELADLEVAGYNGHAKVKLETPKAVHYGKTKAFLAKDGKKANIYGALRYTF